MTRPETDFRQRRQQEVLEARRQDMAKVFEKLPPHALEAEMSLLGAMILDWKVIGDVVQILGGSDDFYNPAHGVIYESLIHLYDKTQVIDLVPLKQRLEDLGHLEKIGGVKYLLALAEGTPSPAGAVHYARLVREKAVLRKLIDASGQILHDSYHSAEPVTELLDRAEQAIFKIADARTKTDEASDLGTLLQETYARLEALEGKHYTGLVTGFRDLDDMTSGLQAGELIIIAARPSMGKTALALNMAENIAVNGRQSTAVFSLEMSKQQLAQRLLCSRSGVNSQKLKRNMLSGEEFHLLAETVGQLQDSPLYIDDTPGLTLMALRAKARRLASRFGIKGVFVDYLQLMSCPGFDSREQEVSAMSRGLKAIARELDIPIICLSQLNRGPEGRDSHRRPRMSDLRESGAIEQDADVIMLLHRESYFHKGDEEWAEQNRDKMGLTELIIAKQRNGPTDTVQLQFDGATTRFHDRMPGS